MEKVSDWLIKAMKHLDMAKCNIDNCRDESCKMKYNSEFEHTDYHVDAALEFMTKIAKFYKITE